jgi:hypothetical protein
LSSLRSEFEVVVGGMNAEAVSVFGVDIGGVIEDEGFVVAM